MITSKIKFWLTAGVIIAAVAALAYMGHKAYAAGAASVQAKWDKSKADIEAAHHQEVARLEKINRQVVVKYLYRDRYIEGQTKTIVKEVPIYVTAEDDKRCDIPDGFMLVRHAATEGRLPTDYDRSDFVGAGATVALSDLSTNDVENYGTCHRNAAQLDALISAITQQMQGR